MSLFFNIMPRLYLIAQLYSLLQRMAIFIVQCFMYSILLKVFTLAFKRGCSAKRCPGLQIPTWPLFSPWTDKAHCVLFP